MTCEADEVKDEEQDGGPPVEVKKGHGGCGHHQPQVRKEGLKLFFNYKKQNDEEVGLTNPTASCHFCSQYSRILALQCKISDKSLQQKCSVSSAKYRERTSNFLGCQRHMLALTG